MSYFTVPANEYADLKRGVQNTFHMSTLQTRMRVIQKGSMTCIHHLDCDCKCRLLTPETHKFVPLEPSH